MTTENHKNIGAKNGCNTKGYGQNMNMFKWDGCKKRSAKGLQGNKLKYNMAAENSMQIWLQKKWLQQNQKELQGNWQNNMAAEQQTTIQRWLQKNGGNRMGCKETKEQYHGCWKSLCRDGCGKMAATKTAAEKTPRRTATDATTLTLQSWTFLSFFPFGGFQFSMSRPHATSMTRMVSPLFPRWCFGWKKETKKK